MLKEFFERRRVKKVFSKLVDPAVVEGLLDELAHDLPDAQAPQPGQIEFVICYPRDEQPSRASEILSRIVEIGRGFEAQVDIESGSYVSLWFRPGASIDRLKLVDEIRCQLGADLKLIHGSEPGAWGVFQYSKLAKFGFAIPGFDAVLGQLASLQFGEAKLFRK